MGRIFLAFLLAITFSCAEEPAKKKKQQAASSEDLLAGDENGLDQGGDYPQGSNNNGSDDNDDNNNNDDDDDDDDNDNGRVQRWEDEDGNEWAMLPKRMNWCSAAGIDVEEGTDDLDGIDLNNLSPDNLTGLLSTFQNSGLGDCLKDDGSGTKKGDLDDPSGGLFGSVLSGGGLSGILSGGTDNLDIGDVEEGCREALGRGWRLPKLSEMEDVDTEKLLKKIPDAEDREFWTSTTVEADQSGSGTSGATDLTGLLGNFTGGFDISTLLASGIGGSNLPIDLNSMSEGPIGAFTYDFDRERDDTAGKQTSNSVICIKD